MSTPVTIGGVEYHADLDSFLKVETIWGPLKAVSAAYAERGEPSEDFPDGVPAPNVGKALTNIVYIVAVGTFDVTGVTDKDFDVKLEAHVSMIRSTLQRHEIARVREVMQIITAEGELTGNGEPDAPPADVTAPTQNPSTETSTASTPNL